MKHLLLLISASATLLSLNAQDRAWYELLDDPTANLFEIQQQAEAYFDIVGTGKGTGWKAYKRWEYRAELLADEHGNLSSAQSLLDGLKEHQINLTAENYNSTTGDWTELGPFDVPTNGTGQPTGLGRLCAIGFHPVDTNILYVGAASGGIWKSTDAGANWVNITNDLPTLGISSIVVHPTGHDTIYVGTGDRDASDAPGLGVYRSTDGGNSWSAWNSGIGNRTMYEILMHPNDPRIMIASSNGRIHRTMDGGATWGLSYSGGENFKDIAFKPGDPDIVYAASNEFFRSTNNGTSFTKITSGLPTNAARIAIATSPNQPTWVYLFAGRSSGFVGLYQSTNSGLSFNTQSTTPNICGYGVSGGSGSQAWYDLVLMGDPTDANTIYAGAINIWKSNNGGIDWELMAHWTGSGGADDIHADQHVLEWHPITNAIFNGNDGGIYRSRDDGITWTDISDDLAIAQAYKIGQSALTKDLCINGYQDNGTGILRPAGWWTEIGGDGMECQVDPTDDSYMYGELYYGAIRRSTNGGNSFGGITNGISESGGWITPFKLDPNDPARMWVGMKQIWRTDDVRSSGQPVWDSISGFPGNNNCVDIAIAPSNSNVVYVSRSGSNNLWRSDDALSPSPSWTNLEGNLPAGGTPRDLEISPTDPNTLWMALGNRVYKSIDAGLSWTNWSSGLPSMAVRTLVRDVNGPPDAIYAGQNVGVYYRDASLGSWIPFSDGLPLVEITELELYHEPGCPAGSRLRAGTYGRGLWETPLCDPGNIPPVACFDPSDNEICVGDTVTLNDNSCFNPTNWLWVFNAGGPVFVNGTSDTSQHPQVVFTAPGTINATLQATNANGLDVVNEVITINPLPVVDLGSDTSFCAGSSVLLNAGFGFDSYDWSTGDTLDNIIITQPGSYALTVTDSNGCVNSDDISIAELPLPLVALGNDTTVCDHATVILDAGPGQAAYSWSTSETSQQISIDAGALGVGQHQFSVVVVDANGCQNTDQITIEVVVCVGLPALSEDFFDVRPNPTSGQLIVRLHSPAKALRLLDYSGRLLQSIQHPEAVIALDLSEHSNGVYLIEVVGQQHLARTKVIKSR